MERSFVARIRADLALKMVILTGPRQVGKTTLAQALAAEAGRGQYLNWDVPGDRRILRDQAWNPRADLLVFDEIHKMPDWKAFLKGAWDGRGKGQAILVTGSARMETFRQAGASLAGRYYALRLYPLSVRECVDQLGGSADDWLDRLMTRGGFPEPLLAEADAEAERWRRQYFSDIVREDVLEMGRIHELKAMRLLVEMLRERVGSPLSIASLARDLQLTPNTVARYLDILEALFVVFTVRPFHRNVARAILKEPKVYFFDTGFVSGDEGARFENACAVMLLKHVHFLCDTEGREVSLHYVRSKEGAEVDFAVCEKGEPVGFLECKLGDARVSYFMKKLAAQFPGAGCVHAVCRLRQEEFRDGIAVVKAAGWLAALAA